MIGIIDEETAKLIAGMKAPEAPPPLTILEYTNFFVKFDKHPSYQKWQPLRLNIWTCPHCGYFEIGRDMAKGVTPAYLPCMTVNCESDILDPKEKNSIFKFDKPQRSTMISSFYRVYDQRMRESLQWRRPTYGEYLKGDPEYRAHVENGGLIPVRVKYDPVQKKLVDQPGLWELPT